MGDLIGPLVVATITLGIYKIFELFVRKNERMAMIEKLSVNYDPQLLKEGLKIQFDTNQRSSWAIKTGLLLVGIGLGVTIACIIDINTPRDNDNWRAIRSLYPACSCLFGGLGLVIAYLIERKDNKKDDKQ